MKITEHEPCAFPVVLEYGPPIVTEPCGHRQCAGCPFREYEALAGQILGVKYHDEDEDDKEEEEKDEDEDDEDEDEDDEEEEEEAADEIWD